MSALGSRVGNALWVGANLPGALRFLGALGRVRTLQERLLRRTLEANRDTLFGRRHRFSTIRSVEDFRERVPLSTFDDYQEEVAAIAAGRPGILTREPVLLFEPSSGSTAAAKWIPFTASLQAQIRAAVAPWMADLYGRWPSLLGGPAYWSISPAMPREGAEASVVPVGFSEDSAYLGGTLQRLVDQVLAVPAGVARIQDVDRFRHVTLLHLLRHGELRFLSVWHPSFLLLLLDHLRENLPELVRDLARGAPEYQVPASPARAAALRDVDPGGVREIWPRLTLVSCWADGHARGAAADLRERLGGLEIQPKGLLATEGFVTIPFQERQVLAVTSHYFEFRDQDGAIHGAHELAEGGRYEVLLTTAGGLYRYRLQDLVEVTGHLRQTPCLRFLGKLDRVVDLRGEKLTEGFVSACLESLFSQRGLVAGFALLAPEEGEGAPRYRLFLELRAPGSRGVPPGELAGALDRELGANPHYRYCRHLGQLAPAEVQEVGPGAFSRYASRLRERGQRLGDLKPAALSPLTGWQGWLA